MEAACAPPAAENGAIYIYDSLPALQLGTDTDTDASASDVTYAVLRNVIGAEPGPSSAAADSSVPCDDFISLDVSGGGSPFLGTPAWTAPESSCLAPAPEPAQASVSAWFHDGRRFRSPMLQLHKEILDFCNFISPNAKEQDSRSAAVQSVSDVVKHIWPHCSVEVFGSFRTGLYLPTSDIDVVILDSKVKTPQVGLKALAKALSQRNIAKKIQVIAKARVPIIKFIEKQSGVAFDVSFDIDGGPKAADFIKDVVKKMPALRPLCMILKVFLYQRELNEVYSGGIGSYALLAMVITHLQMNWGVEKSVGRDGTMEHNLGILLIKFFEFYGRKLNNTDVGISCNSQRMFFLKREKGFDYARPSLLAIQDPQAEDNDIGKNSYNYYKVKSAFSMAYATLTDAITITSLGPARCILGTIIRADPLLLNRRGGDDGDLRFNDLLPGAGEPLSPQFDDQNDMVHNWNILDDDEPLPRGNGALAVDTSRSPPQKRKSTSHGKQKPRKKEKRDGSSGGSVQSERSKRRKGTREYDKYTNSLPRKSSTSRW